MLQGVNEVDIIGQQPILNGLYTQLCLAYPLPDPIAHAAVVTTLTSGLERLSASFPWIAGKVINEGSGEGSTGVFKVVPHETIPRLVVKDLRGDASAPTMDGLRKSNFPMHMLSESILAPRSTFPDPSALDNPVFLLQANFIQGGLLLTLVGLHSAMDMTGQGEIMRLLSKACHGEPFTEEELKIGNAARQNTIPLLEDSWQPGPELSHQIIKAVPGDAPSAPPSVPKCSWALFAFSTEKVAALKALAMETATSDYVSTDDALSAFLWQSYTRARLARLDPSTTTMFVRTIDPRRYLGLSPAYPGMMMNSVYSSQISQELIKEPLGVVASRLREAVDPHRSNVGHATRALATVLTRSPDKSIVSYTADADLASDVMFSSWAKIGACSLDFNLGLGKPESIRRPAFFPPGMMPVTNLLPKQQDGTIAAAIVLRDEDMERD